MGRLPERPTFLSGMVSPFGPLEGVACVTEQHDSYIPGAKRALNGSSRRSTCADPFDSAAGCHFCPQSPIVVSDYRDRKHPDDSRSFSMEDLEKLGTFYLGREYDLATKETGGLLLYDSKDLVTHGVCVGMTGSGKTGLCIALLEEAALDGIPAIVIDPKGDLGDLLLTFPDLRPEDFQPWVDPEEAAKKGLSAGGLREAAGGDVEEGAGRMG